MAAARFKRRRVLAARPRVELDPLECAALCRIEILGLDLCLDDNVRRRFPMHRGRVRRQCIDGIDDRRRFVDFNRNLIRGVLGFGRA